MNFGTLKFELYMLEFERIEPSYFWKTEIVMFIVARIWATYDQIWWKCSTKKMFINKSRITMQNFRIFGLVQGQSYAKGFQSSKNCT